MDFGSIPLFAMMRTKMQYAGARQSVLAENIANADTPGYKAKDIREPDFKSALASASAAQKLPRALPMTITNAQHMGSGNGAAAEGNPAVINRKSTYELNPTGNNVVLEEEMAEMADNQMEYQKILGMYRKTVDMFKTAIGKPSA